MIVVHRTPSAQQFLKRCAVLNTSCLNAPKSRPGTHHGGCETAISTFSRVSNCRRAYIISNIMSISMLLYYSDGTSVIIGAAQKTGDCGRGAVWGAAAEPPICSLAPGAAAAARRAACRATTRELAARAPRSRIRGAGIWIAAVGCILTLRTAIYCRGRITWQRTPLAFRRVLWWH